MYRITTAVMLILGATATAQAESVNSFIPARKSPTEFYKALAACEKYNRSPLHLEPAYKKCMLEQGWDFIYIPPTD